MGCPLHLRTALWNLTSWYTGAVWSGNGPASRDPDTRQLPGIALEALDGLSDDVLAMLGRMVRNSLGLGTDIDELGVLLLTSAATTVATGLRAYPWVTTLLAAASFALTGARSTFDWNSLGISRTNAFHEIQAAIRQYQFTPQERRDEDAPRRLVTRVDEIAAAERASWANRRERISGES